MKFLKTIRFDPSDLHVFDHAADPDEWAIPGGFRFAGMSENSLAGKPKQAFSNSFLSLRSYGCSTFVSVSEIGATEVERLQADLARHFVDAYAAPGDDAARAAAVSEIAYVVELCADVPINTVFTLHRSFEDTGAIREAFRIVAPDAGKMHTRVWDIVEE